MSSSKRIAQIAKRNGFSEAAVSAALRALEAGNGTLAQFDHPELGGMGQWMPGMIMIGDFSNGALRDRVGALFSELAREGLVGTSSRDTRWWPDDLGTPAQTGGQNDIRYALFTRANRLVVRNGRKLIVYDTSGHEVTGASQQQAGSFGSIVIHTRRGVVPLDSLTVVEMRDRK
jgi:hypothetical protein